MRSLFSHLFITMALMCAPAGAAPRAQASRTLAEGSLSAIGRPLRQVVRTQAEWAKLWKAHGRGEEAPPKVDWSKEMVVAVFAGSRPTGGYKVKVGQARPLKGKLRVAVVEQVPPPGSVAIQVITSPFHMVAVPKSSLPIAWGR
jgi:hypothetical protein